MVNRRFSRVATSDDDDDDRPKQRRKRKRMKLLEEEEEELEEEEEEEEEEDEEEEEEEEDEDDYDSDNDNTSQQSKKKKNKKNEGRGKDKAKEAAKAAEEESPQEDAKPLGEPIRVSGKGRGRKRHYQSFEFDGNQYELEDPVLLVPEETDQKPYVAIIKDITLSCNGSMMVTGQWFYRPEEASQQEGGHWQSKDTRELFYSFHRDDVPAESVMHKCVVHFVPLHKQLPNRKEHPGFIVQKVYDTVEKKLWRLTDKDYEDVKQQELDELVQKTLQRIGKLLDIEAEEAPPDQEDATKDKRNLRTKSTSPLDVSGEDDGTLKGNQLLKPETPRSCVNNASEYYHILVNFNVLTGNTHRDKWLEKLLEHVRYMCKSDDSFQKDDKRLENVNSDETKNRNSESANDCQDMGQKSSKSFLWPDAAVPAVVALEKASNDAFPSDFQKYNKKLRQLDYNLSKNALLARRLLNGELQPSKIVNMTPNELKEAITAEEKDKEEPDESQLIRMTDARCQRCMELKVGLREIIHAGHGDRYQLECVACGNSWYASRDEASMLTIDAPVSKKSLMTAPSTTSKIENEEKKLESPHDSEKLAPEKKKASEVCIPESDAQK
ncbi:hypothetical protein PIB30_035587 [Stylosanthes scabra]|uniref:Uncharacterized protein n=1 Tax=Stylosanthes scabra TaxID=79078 RepID=A0ABU6VCH2_9FABA|nr:hypothetical protein [Stylosanthes scabra]